MKMLNSVSLTCVVIVMIQCELQASAELANVKSDIEWQIRSRQGRQMINKLARKGQEAVDTLVRGAHQVLGGDKFVRLYEKSGSYATAVKEFKSLNPAGVTRLSDQGMIGTVGDRTIMLQKKGISGKPTIRIMKHNSAQSSERIVYFDDKI